jgi:hypothetical protein
VWGAERTENPVASDDARSHDVNIFDSSRVLPFAVILLRPLTIGAKFALSELPTYKGFYKI